MASGFLTEAFIMRKTMNVAVYIGKKSLENDVRLVRLLGELASGGCVVTVLVDGQMPDAGTDMLLSVGGDGTFLSASALVVESGIPVAGVNLGRLGFLSENRPEDVAGAILRKEYSTEDTAVLSAVVSTAGGSVQSCYALNECTVHRNGAAMLGVEVAIDGVLLPTYWADGLIVSTSSGSTAYSLSAGGPIALPGSRVLIITPIAPHNLNVRPLVVPDTSGITLRVHSRDRNVIFTADNMTAEIDGDTEIAISVAQFSLKRIRLNKSDFINALTEKLFWGEDVRNIK